MKIISNTLKLLLLLSISVSLSAQNKGSIDERIEKETQIMIDELQLNDTQAKQVSEINLKYGHLMADARKSANGNRDELRSKMKNLNKERNEKLKKILSEEQFQKHLKALETKRQNRSKRKEGRPS